MNHQMVLLKLLEHIKATSGNTVVGFDETQKWNKGVLDTFIELGLLKRKAKAKSLVCQGCEYACYQDIHILEKNEAKHAFIVCDVPEMQGEMGRVSVSLGRLQQWQSSAMDIAKVTSKLLSIETNMQFNKSSESFQLGMLQGKHGRCWLILHGPILTFELNHAEIAATDFLFFENNQLAYDQFWVEEQLKRKPQYKGKDYTPSTSKQEARKQKTQAMYQDWQDKYMELARENPDKSYTWIAKQIEKLPIAQGRSYQTIEKNMR